MAKALTAKQQRFVDEYLVDLNATRAYMAAFETENERSAAVSAAKLLRNPKVAAAINAAKQARSEATKIDAAYVLQRLHEENEADLADLYDKATGQLKPVHKWPLIWRKGLIQGVDVEELTNADGDNIGRVKKVKVSDRIKRTELIGKHVTVQAFKEQVEVSGTIGLAERVARAKQRAGQ